MKRNKKGISLITLVITIIIMIILAAAIVLTLTQSGIFDKANDAVDAYDLKQVQTMMDLVYAEEYATGTRDKAVLQQVVNQALKDNNLNSKYKAKVTDTGVIVTLKGAITSTVASVANQCMDENTVVADEYGNKIVIPAGFKIRVDEGERTSGDEKSLATNVTQGIVIEDCTATVTKGSQFVWVPVGTIYTNVQKTESKTITLGRYAYDIRSQDINDYILKDGEYKPGENIILTEFDTDIEEYITCEFVEETAKETGLGQYGNAIARNIVDFVTSATQNRGYYIGRYEAGDSSNIEFEDRQGEWGGDSIEGTLVCKSNQVPYNYIRQQDASSKSKNMYNNGADGYNANTFSSDLINSYAWDTAIIFIQTFGGETAYYVNNYCGRITTTGGNKDEFCNINDMSGNAMEWSTETCVPSNEYSVCRGSVCRGGSYSIAMESSDAYTSTRALDVVPCHREIAFRPILYVAITE